MLESHGDTDDIWQRVNVGVELIKVGGLTRNGMQVCCGRSDEVMEHSWCDTLCLQDKLEGFMFTSLRQDEGQK